MPQKSVAPHSSLWRQIVPTWPASCRGMKQASYKYLSSTTSKVPANSPPCKRAWPLSYTHYNTALKSKHGGQTPLLSSWHGVHKKLYLLIYNSVLILFHKLFSFRHYNQKGVPATTTKAYLTVLAVTFFKMSWDRLLILVTNKLQKPSNKAYKASLSSIAASLLVFLHVSWLALHKVGVILRDLPAGSMWKSIKQRLLKFSARFSTPCVILHLSPTFIVLILILLLS